MTAYLHCTKKVRDFTGIDMEPSSDHSVPPPSLGNWYVHMFTVDRRKTLVFLSDTTLLSFVTFGIKKSNSSDLRVLFLLGLKQLLWVEEVPDEKIEQVVSEYGSISYAKASDRTALGHMNDRVDRYKYRILDDGGFASCDVALMIHDMNRLPERKLNWRVPVEAMRKIIEGPIATDWELRLIDKHLYRG